MILFPFTHITSHRMLTKCDTTTCKDTDYEWMHEHGSSLDSTNLEKLCLDIEKSLLVINNLFSLRLN